MWSSPALSARFGLPEILILLAIAVLIYGVSRLRPGGPSCNWPGGPFAH